jgi:hypothetical protein
MISLASDYLLFQLASGESVPFSADMISVEVMGDAADVFEPEFVKHAAASVFHYFKHELGRETISVAEFAGALEKVLRGLGYKVCSGDGAAPAGPAAEGDLRLLADESGEGCELVFFPRLRDALRALLRHSPQRVRFHGLRGCVKQLAGARRWSPRCQTLHDQIVGFLRECLSAEPRDSDCTLVVE